MSIFGKPFLTGVGKGSASGAVASFTDGAKGLPLKSLLVDIDPVQDLHGYDNPWPAGGGVNKLLPKSEDQTITTDYGISGNYNASTETVTLNGTNNTGTAKVPFSISSGFMFSADLNAGDTFYFGGYIPVGCYSQVVYRDTNNALKILKWKGGSSGFSVVIGTVPDDFAVFARVDFGVDPGATLSNVQVKIIFTVGATAPTAWSPYSNICPISGWSAVNVWRTGKNLFDVSEIPQIVNGMAITVNNNGISYSGTASYSGYGPLVSFKLPKEGQYHFHLDGDGNWLRGYTNLGKDITVDVTDTSQIYRLSLPSFTAGNQYSGTISNVQIELGPTATPYEPYSGNQYTIQLGQTVYGGTLDETNGVLTVDRAMVDLGTLNWAYNPTASAFESVGISNLIKSCTIGVVPNIICSSLETKTGYNVYTSGNGIGQDGTKLRAMYTGAGADAAAFKTAMSGVQLVYELADPITIQLTPQEITTLLGQNNIWADTGDVDVEYLKQTLMHIGSTIRLPHYGCVWDQEHAQMRRTGLARTITTNTQNFKHSGSVNPNYDNPFDNIYPWSERKLCNISLTLYQALQPGDNIKDCVTYWETDDGFSYNDPDGVWVYTPEFWGTSYWIGSQRYFEVSPVELAGYHHYKEQITARWRGVSETRTIDGTNKTILLSKPGLPIVNTALSTIHTYAKNGGMTLDSVYTLDASLLLYLVEYANYNAQSSIGNGVSDLYDQTTLHPDEAVTAGTTLQFTGLTSAQLADFIVGAIVDFGTASGGAQTARTYITAVETASSVTTMTLADAVTITTDTFVSIHGHINYADADIGSMSGYIGMNGKSDAYYRGEALWGNMFFYTLGAYKSDTEHVWLAEEGTEDNYDAINMSVHTDTGIVLASANNYIKKLAWPDLLGTLFACSLCTEVGGTFANPVGDYFYTSAGSNRILLVGGNARDGTGDGPFSWYWYIADNYSAWSCSGRPLLKTP